MEHKDEMKCEKETSEKKKKRWVLWVLSISFAIVVMVVGTGWMVQYELQPKQHFKQGNIPVLAVPKSVPKVSEVPLTKAEEVKMPHDGEFTILLLGIDSRFAGEVSHADSLLLVHVNVAKHRYDVMSVPRDTRVNLPKYGLTKITHAHFFGGTQETIQAVSDLLGVTIHYYAETNYWGLKDIVDSIGGIEVNVPFDMKLGHSWYPENRNKKVSKGVQFLNGTMVTEIVHERYSLAGGDFSRQEMQKEVLLGIGKRVLRPVDVSKISTFIDMLPKFLVATNMSTSDMLSLALHIKDFDQSQVHYYQVPGHSAYEMDPILKRKVYYWIPDMGRLRKLMAENF